VRRQRYQFGTVSRKARKNGPDVWVFRFLERVPEREPLYRSVTIGTVEQYPKKAQAEKAAESLRMLANPDQPNARGMSFGGMIDTYMTSEMSDRYSTGMGYKSYIKNYIRPKWSEYALEDIKPFAVEKWLKSLPLAPKSKGHIKNIMSVILNCAMRFDLLPATGENVMRLVRVKGISKRKKTPRALTVEEFTLLASKITIEPRRTMIYAAVCLGLTASELSGLQWGDFDFEKGSVFVRRAVVSSRVGDTKNEYREAPLPLHPLLGEMMLAWKKQTPWNGKTDWVFASPFSGGEKPYTLWNAQHNWLCPAAEEAGIGKIGWHTFRHTYSTMLRRLGVDVKVQQELLRHADIRTTLNVYTHGVSEDLRAANVLLGNDILPGRVM